jgi:drug/metabolite transporter (DMT)-like permease
VFALYVSTERIGPFRTALFMNLEPLMTSTFGAVLLGERLTPVQMLGGVTMIAALCVFQMRRQREIAVAVSRGTGRSGPGRAANSRGAGRMRG